MHSKVKTQEETPRKPIRKKRGNLTCAYCKNYNDGFCINWHINVKENETPCQGFELADF